MEERKWVTQKVTVLKGTLGDMAREWMTEEDHARHNAYVEELKAKGEYLQPEEMTIS
jgi:hypothetical protein